MFDPCKGIAASTDIDALKRKIDKDIAYHEKEIKEKDRDPLPIPEQTSQLDGVDRQATDTGRQVEFSNRTGESSFS